MSDKEREKFDTWTGDILLGIEADKDTVSLLHVGKMVRMIYDKGCAEGAERALRDLADCKDPHGALDEMIDVKENAERASRGADVIGRVIAKYEKKHPSVLTPKDK